MAVDIHKLIAAISPETFCQEWIEEDGQRVNLRKKVRETVKEKGYLEGAKIAKPVEAQAVKPDEYAYSTAIKAPGIKNPVEKHTITYDAANENLEPIYFWILDYLNTEYKKSAGVDKIVDNFVSSVGSSHFSEMGMKATKMQDEAMKMLGSANQVIKSIINILYDLKEFKIRLDTYKLLHSDNLAQKNSAIQSLKQIWLDTVDMKRGNTAIKAMAAQYQYVTLIDAFFAANSVDDVQVTTKEDADAAAAKTAGNMDVNDRVKRILQQRLGEFYRWLDESERELEKRFEIEKIYLRSQVNSVRLYSHWMKPYLKAAKNLEQRASADNIRNAALVNAFNTTLFELTLLAKGDYDLMGDVTRGELPPMFSKSKTRKYSSIIVVELNFRSIPGRAGNSQNYSFRGRLEAKFTSYALNADEIKVLEEQVEKDDLKDAVGLIEGATEKSLELLTTEINEYLDETKKEEDKKEEKKSEDVNPFSALFGDLFTGWFSGRKSDEKPDLTKGVPKDSDMEKIIRSQAIIQARGECSKMYASFKKAQSMAA